MKDIDPLATYAGLMPYEAARAEAQRKANASGRDFGVERVHPSSPVVSRKKVEFSTPDVFRVVTLPAAEFRFGYELRCEVVHPTTGSYQPGHGPEMHPACGWFVT